MENIQKAKSEDLYTDNPALIAAQKVFHIDYLYPWQQLVISNIMEAAAEAKAKGSTPNIAAVDTDEAERGKQIVLLPTGAGKSLCFLIPALLLPGATLVIYPLLALMSDQKRRMDENGISNVVFCGNQSKEEREECFKKIAEGARVILANPEVLQNEALVERLSECGIVHAAIDEAHCVSEWGDSFRPSYLTLGKILEKLKVPLITAFTATASPEVFKRMSEILFGGQAHLVRSESDRPNIHYNVIYAYAKKNEILRLALTEKRPMLIFCGSRLGAENAARNLRTYFSALSKKTENSYNSPEIVKFYHAGLSREEKAEVEKWFFPKENAILSCTCAFGMGVDKKNIRTVIHMDVPHTVESFIQESGRGARDGGIAESYLLWNYDDYKKFSSFPENSRERALLHFAESRSCRRQVLLDALGAEQAACSGCDICKLRENNGNEKTGLSAYDHTNAWDRNFTIGLLRHYSKSLIKEEAQSLIEKRLNHLTMREFKMNVWESGDVEEIIKQLQQEKQIYTCRWPWKNKIAVAHIRKNKRATSAT
ncbi:RecQ family ATP-dependent DNA helicase [Treponema parvum]|uniref:RecQ family ATP-dependent DNA helicase n=1 Tax=Treponema parvum TaxID=138851 RepID=UPI001AEC369A|nr:RecQ family ATP-dependent DNA helicase [Treponema parvum]QTQ16917.1 ATP-dependent DNA helicase RecQ [Treponema parvum]